MRVHNLNSREVTSLRNARRCGLTYREIARLFSLPTSTVFGRTGDVTLSSEAEMDRKKSVNERRRKAERIRWQGQGKMKLNTLLEVVKRRCIKCKVMLDISKFYYDAYHKRPRVTCKKCCINHTIKYVAAHRKEISRKNKRSRRDAQLAKAMSRI